MRFRQSMGQQARTGWTRLAQARRALGRYGVLGEARLLAQMLQEQMRWFPPGRRLFAAAERSIDRFQLRRDFRSFDEAQGTDTCGLIPLADLTVTGGNAEDGVWYEAVPPAIFRQLMTGLRVSFGDYGFIDFGSGKGRALLLAAGLGFRRVTGVEFARELHEVAVKNITLFQSTAVIESRHQDAADFPIPDAPLVAFFYCPFRGPVLDQVLGHLTASHARRPRPMILILVGLHSGVTAQFQATGFACREIELRWDWASSIRYRALVFTPPGL